MWCRGMLFSATFLFKFGSLRWTMNIGDSTRVISLPNWVLEVLSFPFFIPFTKCASCSDLTASSALCNGFVSWPWSSWKWKNLVTSSCHSRGWIEGLCSPLCCKYFPWRLWSEPILVLLPVFTLPKEFFENLSWFSLCSIVAPLLTTPLLQSKYTSFPLGLCKFQKDQLI